MKNTGFSTRNITCNAGNASRLTRDFGINSPSEGAGGRKIDSNTAQACFYETKFRHLRLLRSTSRGGTRLSTDRVQAGYGTTRVTMGRRGHGNRNDAGSLLASVFILALGGGCSLFTVAAMSPASLPTAMWTVGGIIGAFMVFVILQRFGKVPSGDMGFILSSRRNKRDDGLAEYEPRKAGDPRPIVVGTNQPISAAEVHEIKVTSANTWVPANSASGRRKQEKEK